ncbi:hypothetical protein M5K25_026502 [Dendrobium thyrsiflorum]|uniref:Uncharacterized protein n=1 Tax=Dendrobium thyrsiflorum TaxID=117978 RepID=A0ABD0TXE7_DENTH
MEKYFKVTNMAILKKDRRIVNRFSNSISSELIKTNDHEDVRIISPSRKDVRFPKEFYEAKDVFGNAIPYYVISIELRKQWSKFGSSHLTNLGWNGCFVHFIRLKLRDLNKNSSYDISENQEESNEDLGKALENDEVENNNENYGPWIHVNYGRKKKMKSFNIFASNDGLKYSFRNKSASLKNSNLQDKLLSPDLLVAVKPVAEVGISVEIYGGEDSLKSGEEKSGAVLPFAKNSGAEKFFIVDVLKSGVVNTSAENSDDYKSVSNKSAVDEALNSDAIDIAKSVDESKLGFVGTLNSGA